MFVQVIEGRVSDAAALRARIEQWQKDVMPGAVGYLGSTGGVTDDGRFFTIARFETAEQAARNSARPEQDAWWRETERLFDGPVAFRDSDDVEVFLSGGSDTAGFVQVMQGSVADREALAATEQKFVEQIRAGRPDLIGGVRAWHDGNEYTAVNYFTSEAAARRGESQEPPAEMHEMREQWETNVKDVRFLDLREPWLVSG